MFLPWPRPERPIRNRKSFSVCSLPAELRGRSSTDCNRRSFGCSPCLRYTNAWPRLGSSRSAARQRNSRTASERRSRNGQRSSTRPDLRRSRFTPALIAHDQHRAFGVAHHMARIGAEKISAHRVALCPARGHNDEIGPHAVRLFQNLLVDAALADGGGCLPAGTPDLLGYDAEGILRGFALLYLEVWGHVFGQHHGRKRQDV